MSLSTLKIWLATSVVLLRSVLVSAQAPVVSQFPVPTQTSFPSPQCTAGSSSQTERFTVNYNFETVERGDPVVATSEIGVYNLLSFDNINFVDTDPDFDGNHLGLAPHTYPNVATFSGLTEGLIPTAPKITAGYAQSTLASFDADSFWYGCVYPFPYTAGSLPRDCNITATGFNAAGAQIAEQVFHFKANGSIVQDQNFGKFKGFTGVRSVTFGVTSAYSSAALIDNFIAKLSQLSCAPYYTGSYNNGT